MKIDKDYVFPVYVYENIIKHIIRLCKNSDLEICGYLSGNIYQWKKDLYVVIEEHLFIEGAVQSEQYSTSPLEGELGQYGDKLEELKKTKKNENLRIVGWWHSHPGFTCFLSSTDIETQRAIFPLSYQVALVVDPVNDELAFFTLEDNSNDGYKEIAYAIIK